jgi:hypothetical protein
LRPLAIAVRQFSACAHAMPAQPLWGGAVVAVNSRSLFHSGAAGSEAVLALACRRSGLSLPPSAAGEAHARTRWRQLQQAMVAVFDVRGGSEAERAGVCYELGIALTLGRPLVVLASPGQELPFDIDVDPVQVAGDGQAEQTMVADVLDRAVCWAWPEVSGQPWQLALDHVLASAASADPSNTYVQQTDRLLRDPATRRDRLASVRALAKRLDFVNDGRTRLVFPHWCRRIPLHKVSRGSSTWCRFGPPGPRRCPTRHARPAAHAPRTTCVATKVRSLTSSAPSGRRSPVPATCWSTSRGSTPMSRSSSAWRTRWASWC